jgi:hypothetical protein
MLFQELRQSLASPRVGCLLTPCNVGRVACLNIMKRIRASLTPQASVCCCEAQVAFDDEKRKRRETLGGYVEGKIWHPQHESPEKREKLAEQ